MRLKHLALCLFSVGFLLSDSPAFAQRGGRGGYGGGMPRGGFGGGGYGGGAQRGGYGAGGGAQRGYGGDTAQHSVSSGPGGYQENTSYSSSGRPGAGGAYGGPASGRGVLPGAGYGRPGVGVGGAGSGLGARPGAGWGAAGVPGGYGYGTHYAGYDGLGAGWGAGAGYRAAGAGYPNYSAAMYAGYPGAWAPANMASASLYNNPGYGATSGQLGLNAQPAPYDYGSNVVVQPDAVYVNGDQAGTPQQYEDQAKQLAGAGQSAQPDPDAKWLPVGIFAVAEGDPASADSVFQIAVNPQGIIRGNYHNRRTNKVEPISGSVDKQTQRAAWVIGSDKTPVYDAGIANLIKDSTTILVHTGRGQSHQVTLVRLQPPEQSPAADAGPAARP